MPAGVTGAASADACIAGDSTPRGCERELDLLPLPALPRALIKLSAQSDNTAAGHKIQLTAHERDGNSQIDSLEPESSWSRDVDQRKCLSAEAQPVTSRRISSPEPRAVTSPARQAICRFSRHDNAAAAKLKTIAAKSCANEISHDLLVLGALVDLSLMLSPRNVSSRARIPHSPAPHRSGNIFRDVRVSQWSRPGWPS